ncbi:hypothetical protein Ahy_B02g061421 [Arachis hypogaea]|uniref:Uncharacterized protein n=1 Tax=Arachis hypogaea TaxID=3818 RepID=A0A445AKW8_ARAHY|nr:hypothetical protein Ahy_B02g061421 [Arachis hypogaea]
MVSREGTLVSLKLEVIGADMDFDCFVDRNAFDALLENWYPHRGCMRLRSGKIIHMADELSNVNGGSSTNDSIPISMQQADVSSHSEGAIETEMNNIQNPQHSEYSRDYHVGSTSNAVNSVVVYRQQVEKSHHDLVNLLTQQMTIILNPMMADHESRFKRLARQVERIA